jgi:lysophospholipase L1-like esterase
MFAHVRRAAVVALVVASSAAFAEQPWTLSNNTRYLSMGDSLAAGYGAIPTTQGYAYLLYQGGTFDAITNTIFANAAVPKVTSADVFAYQVPQASIFEPNVITISVGGNDLLKILNGAPAGPTLVDFATNLTQILSVLRDELPDSRIFINNLYDIPEITANIPGALQIILEFNRIVSEVAQESGVRVADVFSAFEGRTGLLLIERNDADQLEVHPTNAGYRVMATAFQAAAGQ